MKTTLYAGSDHAELKAGRIVAYYGPDYKIDDPDSANSGEWCFCLFKDSKEKMRIPTTQLDDLGNMGSPKDYLLAGIALYLSR